MDSVRVTVIKQIQFHIQVSKMTKLVYDHD